MESEDPVRPVARPRRGIGIAGALILLLLAALPVAVTSMPPLTDLGGHLGRFAVQIHPADPVLSRWYGFAWGLVPNLGVDLLVQGLAPHMGLEPALWWIVLAIPLLQASGLLLLSRTAHGAITPTAIAALPLVYSYPFLFGFLNFNLGIGLALWAGSLWIALQRHGRHAWLPIFAPLGCVLMLCHFAAWAVLAIIATGSTWATVSADRSRTTLVPGRAQVVAMVAALWPLVVPFALRQILLATGETSLASAATFDFPAKLSALVMPLRDRWALWDIAGAIGYIVVLVGCARSSKWRFDRALLACAALITASYLVSPSGMGDLWYIDIRLAPILFATLLVAAGPASSLDPARHRLMTWAAIAFAVARFGGNAISLHESDRQWQSELHLVDQVPAGSLMITLVHETSDHDFRWLRERRTHLAGFALERRHIFSNDQWAVPGGHLLRIHNADAPGFEGDPSERVHTGEPEDPRLDDVVARVPRAAAWLWIIGEQPDRMPARWHRIGQVDDTVLYRST